jgi:hypothetical protein
MDNEKSKQMNAEMSAALFSERERFEMLFADHWKKAAVIGVLIALVVALAFTAWSFANRSSIRATYAFADANDIASLEKALAENSSKTGALAARQRLVQLYIDGKNYDKALQQLKLVASDEAADADVKGKAALTEGLIMELQGKEKDAAARFTRIAGDANCKAALRLEAAAAAARLMAAKDPDGAAAILEKAGKLTADSPRAAQALSEVRDLQIALFNGELGAKPKAKAAKAK